MNLDKMYRQLARVTGVNKEGLWIVIPGFNPKISFLSYFKDMPDKYKNLIVGDRFYCKINLGGLAENINFEWIDE